MTLILDDPFAPAPASADMFDDPDKPTRGDRWLTGGRYRYPNRDGSHHKGGWTRTTNITGAISDAFGLRDWELRNLLCGIAIDPSIYADAVALAAGKANADLKPYMDQVHALLDRAKEVAGGNAGSDHGNREHLMVEAFHKDLPHEMDADQQVRLALYRQAMRDAQLAPVPGMQERRVMLEAYNVCGTLDNVLRCLRYGVDYVGDLKSQRRFWSWMEVEAQEGGYANADAMWEADGDGGRWVDMPAVDRDRAVVLWVPRPDPESGEGPRAEVLQVDIERGWSTFKLAHAVYTRRAEAKSARQAVSGLAWTPAPPVARVEWYSRLIGAVESREEGSRLVAEARAAGVWCDALADVARIVAQRLTLTKN